MRHGAFKPQGYLPRIQDGQLDRMLGAFGAVEVAGTMWCGKTWTSLAFGESVTRVGRETVRLAVEGESVWLPKLLNLTGLVKSTSDGRRMIEQGAVSVEGKKIADPEAQVPTGAPVLLQVGKRRFCRVRFGK